MGYNIHYLVGAAANALIEKIIPNVRVVFASYGYQEACLYVYHEGELTSEEKEDFDRAACSLKHYFPNNYSTYCFTFRVDPPDQIPVMGSTVYVRKGEEFKRTDFDLHYLRLVSVKGLFGLVTPELRKVSVSFCGDKIIINCFFHGEVTDEQRADMTIAANRIKQSFPESYSVHVNIQRLDAPQRVPCIGTPVYARRHWGLNK